MRRLAVPLAAIAALSACDAEAPPAQPQQTPTATATPSQASASAPTPAATGETPPVPQDEAGVGTPLNERVATLGLLNKRNNLSEDIEIRPGETKRIGDVIVRLQSCERTAPWEMPKETGAFVQVSVKQRGTESTFRPIFSGWLFKNSPSLNVVEHPIYDVWVKDCAMAFPGEE